MGLFDRLIGAESPRLSIHPFHGALGEWERGKLTRAQVISMFGIQASEEADLDALLAKIVPPPDSISLGAAVTLANVGTAYDSTTASKGLGFVRVEGAGISGVEFVVRYNKVGTGTLSWQLWDDTTATELGVHEDTVAGDNKQGTVLIVPGAPLNPGLHTLRVRSKSTVGTDDPVYYGSSLRIRRVDVMWSEVLHEVLCIGEMTKDSGPPYNTGAAIKTRLGI